MVKREGSKHRALGDTLTNLIKGLGVELQHDEDGERVLQTIGALFVTLGEMGFTQEQIQGAVQAGHFSVADAAEW